MSLTRKASSAAKKPIKSPRQDLAAALAERDAELAEARSRARGDRRTARCCGSSSQKSPADAAAGVRKHCRRCWPGCFGCAHGGGAASRRRRHVYQRAGTTPEGADAGVRADQGPDTTRAPTFLRGRGPRPDDGCTCPGARSMIGPAEHERHIPTAFVVSSDIVACRCCAKRHASRRARAHRESRRTLSRPGKSPRPRRSPTRRVIAIENARLFREAQEALEQQKASAEVLGAISKSVADASPVFETILDACQRLFGSEELGIYTIGDDQMVRVAAWRGPRAEEARQDVTPLADSVTGRVIRERRPHHIPDLGAVPNLSPTLRDRVNRHGGASLLYAPMLQDDSGLGSIVVVRWPPRPFSDREQALLQTFADQAAIAIENARLFQETQEALRQQTATGDILKVIASSPNNLQPVLDKIVETACRLCSAYDSVVLLREGDQLRPAAHYGPIPLTFASQEISRGLLAGRAVIERRAIHIDDIAKHADEYPVAAALALQGQVAGSGEMLWRANARHAAHARGRGGRGDRTSAHRAHGVLGNPDPVTETCRSGGIAITTRLFNAERWSGRPRPPTSSRLSPARRPTSSRCSRRSRRAPTQLIGGYLEHAVLAFHRRCADYWWRSRRRSPTADEAYRTSFPRPLAEFPPFLLGSRRRDRYSSPTQRRNPACPPLNRELARLRGFRSMLFAPLMSNGVADRHDQRHPQRARRIRRRHVQLLQTFADQAVIAIENVRLFDEVQARTKDLQEALQQQTATTNVLKVISRSAFDLDAVLKTLTDSARSLSGAATAAVFLRDGDALPASRRVGGCSGISSNTWTPIRLAPARLPSLDAWR